MGARYYAAWLGRWTSADPMGIGADGPGIYNYTRGSPVTLSDPSGHGGFADVVTSVQNVRAHAYSIQQEALPPPFDPSQSLQETTGVPDDLTTGSSEVP